MEDYRHIPPKRLPPWLRNHKFIHKSVDEMRSTLKSKRLHTVCEMAKCPNISECYKKPTATFMIMGTTCTRNCRFCNISSGKPSALDPDEPQHVAESALEMGLKHVVITSVTRDDLPDQGIGQFIKTVRAIRDIMASSTTIELLIPDLQGDENLLKELLKEPFEILNHNLETVPRLYHLVRPEADYQRSLELLQRAISAKQITKTGIMVGLGEQFDELELLIKDLVEIGVDALTIGQYLRPSRRHYPVQKFITPEEFKLIKNRSLELGVPHVFAGPLVRSSYNADRLLEEIKRGLN